jgi:phosphoenolpyruvate carboxykinase (ATP)
MSLKHTRALVNAALDGKLDGVEFVREPAFGLNIPVACPGVPREILNPRNVWSDPAAYDRQAADLASRFEANFQQFDAPASVRDAGPTARTR